MAQIILDSNSNLIQGDFDAVTVNNRTKLQTSTTNATTGVYVVPNGTATSASVQIANAADPTNASKLVVATNASTDTQIVSSANGSGSYLPLSFYTNNDIRFQIGNAGELNVRTAPGTVSSGSSGQVLTSGGPGAGVSWATAASGQLRSTTFPAPGTFTVPATVTQVRVHIVGGGGGSSGASGGGPGGGTGGYVLASCPVTSGTPIAVTVGTGGAGGSGPGPSISPGGTSSFGALASATGGTGGAATPGTGTVTTGTLINNNLPARATDLFTGAGGIANQTANVPAAIAWTSAYVAGAGGPSFPTSGNGAGGIGGVVVVEYIG